MVKEWKIPFAKTEIPAALAGAGYGPLLSSILALRGVKTAEEAHALFTDDPAALHDPLEMQGMAKAVARIREAIRRREKLAIYGDYDVDGITSTCLLTDYLRWRGLCCIPYIPDRSEEGYGLNCGAMETLKSQGVQLVITVDCGITAVSEASYARELGMEVIITDHHECKEGALPEAVAVIDCKQPGNRYPNDELAGVGVALKLACAVEGDAAVILERYADLAAVGTVADVMPLTDENRLLVRRGLKKLNTNPRPGFAAMLQRIGVEPGKVNVGTIGFGIAPRLNASGRLSQATQAAELLMCRSVAEAAPLADALYELNAERQKIENEIMADAQLRLGEQPPEEPIVLADENWHQGVIGIAASRLSEKYCLPTVMIYLNGDKGKGSCRSYDGFNLFEALSACSEHLLGFGGHALAAGLTIRRDKIEDFRRALAAYFRKNRPEPQPEVSCELLIRDPELLSVENVRELELLEPYGSGNPRPILCLSDVELEQAVDVGNGKHLKLRVRCGGKLIDGIFFGHTVNELGLAGARRVDVAFTPQINEFRGRVSVQMMVCAVRVHSGRELASQLLTADRAALGVAGAYRPQRADFARLWRSKGSLCLGSDSSAILDACPPGMSEECYAICLAAMLESGLLESSDGSLCGAHRAQVEGKVDLPGTTVMRALEPKP